MAPTDTRALALRILTRWLKTSDFPDRMISGTGPERAFLTELVYGAVRRRRSLEWLIRQCSERSPAPSALPALMLGVQQMLFMDRVPDYAAVNDTVRALRTTTRNRGRVAYVNAILRRIGRERHQLLRQLGEQPIGIRESHPDALVARWSHHYGIEACEALCQWNNTRPGIIVRPRPMFGGMDAYTRALDESRIAYTRHPYRPDEFIALDHGTRVSDLPGFAKGHCAIHDPATATAVDLLAPQPTDRILDACAAPGGKTALIADQMNGEGTLVACDIHADRIAILTDSLKRLQLGNVQVVQADLRAATPPPPICDALFSGILLDVPCTNTGVLRRRPDARWRFSVERMQQTAALQRELLDSAVRFLTPEGRLVYSTCSLEPEENETLITQWVADHPEFTLAASSALFPPDTQTDGAYAALIIKR